MVIAKIIVRRKKQRVHSQYKNHEDALHSAYVQDHIGTHRRVNKQVLSCMEEIGEL